MKSLFYLLLFATLSVSFGACNTTNTTDDAWRTANTNAYDSIAKLPDYHALQTASGPTGVYIKILHSGTGTVYPLQTSIVNVLYQGAFYNGTLFDAGTSLNNVTATFPLTGNSTIRGFSFALQNMVVGDKWEVWIPYYLGYGSAGMMNSSGQTVIQPYTTLVFTVELVSITEYPK